MASRTVALALLAASTILAAIAAPASADGGQGVFELRLTEFKNLVQLDSQGNCCRGLKTPEGRCTGTCDIKFRVCLKHYQAHIDYSSSNLCTFGEYYTPVMSNNIANYDTIAFPLDFKWPVRIFTFVFIFVTECISQNVEKDAVRFSDEKSFKFLYFSISQKYCLSILISRCINPTFLLFFQGTFSLIIEAWHEDNKTSGRTRNRFSKKIFKLALPKFGMLYTR